MNQSVLCCSAPCTTQAGGVLSFRNRSEAASRTTSAQMTKNEASKSVGSAISAPRRRSIAGWLVMAPHPNQVAEEDQQCDHLQGRQPAGRGEEHGQRKQHKPGEAQAGRPARPTSFGGVALGLVLHGRTSRRAGMALANHPNRVRGPRRPKPRLPRMAVAEVVEVAPTPNLLGVELRLVELTGGIRHVCGDESTLRKQGGVRAIPARWHPSTEQAHGCCPSLANGPDPATSCPDCFVGSGGDGYRGGSGPSPCMAFQYRSSPDSSWLFCFEPRGRRNLDNQAIARLAREAGPASVLGGAAEGLVIAKTPKARASRTHKSTRRPASPQSCSGPSRQLTSPQATSEGVGCGLVNHG